MRMDMISSAVNSKSYRLIMEYCAAQIGQTRKDALGEIAEKVTVIIVTFILIVGWDLVLFQGQDCLDEALNLLTIIPYDNGPSL